ncbi:hypothetical protein A1O1_03224 [Capronia coronata CBS 617.96]|uniref:Glutamine amidotransferase domain-containing protein n=1 Tax=Capronia coronata CBS 617.96 TaxID=1182541 RepID=W9YZU7_9EURO|nr:uncharacterized protein A1O1_03224 [Capronia coronata CBS 617.96]EXJ94826.1 hypothetical protein A1O1_03224 [Capronia coronata CBS 617.96]
MGSIFAPAPIHLAILECDTPQPGARARYGTYGGMFEALLQRDPKQIAVTKWQVDQDDAEYPDIASIEAVLMTGSKHSAYLDVPWINKLVAYTQAAINTGRVKIIGICFGHQILGRAMGVEVGLNKAGWEAAVLPVKLSPAGQALFKKHQLNLQFSHQDIVVECPQGVQNLGSTPRCAVQGMYVPGKLISLQGHPEFDETTVREILHRKLEQGAFDDQAFAEGMARVGREQDGPFVGQIFVRFLLDELV